MLAYPKMRSDIVAYKEIVTKAVIGKGKKKYKDTYTIETEQIPSTILGCWIINHHFEAKEINDKINIEGSFDANVWYSYDNDTKTSVINKKITYHEEEKVDAGNNDIVNKEIIIRSLKQPTCISAKEDGNSIKLEIEKELGIEITGDVKMRISSLDEEDDNWQDLDENHIDTNYINEEIIK